MSVEDTSEPLGKQDWRWQYACIDAYKPLISTKGWKLCPACKHFPRLWIFDNGRSAICLCDWSKGPYHNEAVKSISVGEYGRANNWNFSNYDNNALQKAWNKRCENLKGNS